MKVLIVDDEAEIAFCTKKSLIENGIDPGNIIVIMAQSYEANPYEAAKNETFGYYTTKPEIVVLMDYNLGNKERNGKTFVEDLIRRGMPLKNFIGVSKSFLDEQGREQVPGLHCDFGLRRGDDLGKITKEKLGLTKKESNLSISLEPPEMLV